MSQDDAYGEMGSWEIRGRLTSTFTHFSWAKALYSFMSIRSAMVGECDEAGISWETAEQMEQLKWADNRALCGKVSFAENRPFVYVFST